MMRTATATRDLTLDFVKGMLVIGMVVYHVMNIYSTAAPDAYGYIRFVSGSFIMLSGYTIARFYEKRFWADMLRTSGRLMIRGLKLLLVFTALNVLIHLTGVGNPNKAQLSLQQYAGNLFLIYGSGNAAFGSFLILLPIAYLLLAAPLFLLLRRISPLLALAGFGAAYWYSLAALESVNLEFAIMGVIGLTVGMMVNISDAQWFIPSKLVILAALMACMGVMGFLSRNQLTYAIAVLLVIKLIYDFGRLTNVHGRIRQTTVLLGQYSLICYIVQIVLLQGASRLLLGQRWPLGIETIAVVLVTVAFLGAFSVLLAGLCNRYNFVDRSYRSVFS